MFKEDNIKNFVLGALTSFVLSLILDLLGVDTKIIRIIIVVIIILVGYFIISLYKKANNKKI